jgi:tol-pal system protein YbgF
MSRSNPCCLWNRWSGRVFVALVIGVTAVGCTPPPEAMERELEMLRREMASLHARQQSPAAASAMATPHHAYGRHPSYPPTYQRQAPAPSVSGLPVVQLDPLRTDPFAGTGEPPIRLGRRGRQAPPIHTGSSPDPLEYERIDDHGNLIGFDGRMVYRAGVDSAPIDTNPSADDIYRLYEDPHESPRDKVARGTRAPDTRGRHGAYGSPSPGLYDMGTGRVLDAPQGRRPDPRLKQFSIRDGGPLPADRGSSIRVESSRDLDEPPVNVAPMVAAPSPAPPVYEAAPQPTIIAHAPVLAPSPAASPGADPAKPSKVFPPPVRAPGPQKMVSQKRFRGKKEKTVQKLYKKAMAHLNGGKKAEAMEVFVRLLEKYSKHDLADNALYWMGEIAYTDTNYRQALMWFQDVILRYPEGNKLPDSMLKSALCYAKLGDSVYAQKMLSEVETLFAAAPVAKVARERRLALAGQGGR